MRLFPASLLLLCVACPKPTDDTETDPPGEAQWYLTCGDPACQGYTGPFDGVPLCEAQTVGATCGELDAECDPEDDCNARLRCATEDPTQQEGGCPISRVRHKRDVRYLNAEDQARLAAEVRQMKLSTWNYTWDAPERAPRLGFLIDDQPRSAAVTADGEHVDLYGYTSLTVAALQVQAAQIEALQEELRALRAEVARQGEGR